MYGMKKESNGGLFFLLAVGIVGLGLYFGAAKEYSHGELQLYHMICWAVLIIAFLRLLELFWKPVRSLWDQAWGKVQETRMPEHEGRGRRSESEAGYGEYGKDYASGMPMRYEAPSTGPQQSSCPQYAGGKERFPFEEEEEISRADGVIIMPDGSSHLYLDDRSGKKADGPSSEEEDPKGKDRTDPSSEKPEKKKDKKKKKKK